MPISEMTLPLVVVPPHGSANLVRSDLSKEIPFHPAALNLVGELDRLYVTDVKVGRCSQNLCASCLPATLFEARKISLFDFDVVPSPGGKFEVDLYNVSDEEKKIVGRVWGTHDVLNDDTRGWLCGLGVHSVDPGSTITVPNRSQVAFYPEWLHVPPSILESITVDSFDLVRLYQTDDPLVPTKISRLDDPILLDHVDPALLVKNKLSQHLAPLKFMLDTPYTLSDEVRIKVTNHSGRQVHFSGALVGHTH